MLFYSNVIGRSVLRQEVKNGIGYLYFDDGSMIQVDKSELCDDEEIRVEYDEETGKHSLIKG